MIAAGIGTAALAGLLASAPPVADPAGAWIVRGRVAAFSFVVNCTFAVHGAALQGSCVDVSTNDPKVKGGRTHPLTASLVAGDQVSWTYRSSFLIYPFDVIYQGRVVGDAINGAVSAAGRQGRFTAVRALQPSPSSEGGGL